ncbi:MAG: arginine--tRNA ligase [Bacteroidetes bacterium]|nr:arginine--tRNA ligase [Bacteroidota bacterium]
MNQNKEFWLIPLISESAEKLFARPVPADAIILQKTKKEFAGDVTLVCFGLTRFSGKKPEETAQLMGEEILNTDNRIKSYNVVNGFLNLELTFEFWATYLMSFDGNVSLPESKRQKVMVEYSSPNTNKPLHLGHIRNNLLGWSVSSILKACGHTVSMVNLINDRGIHICKSMIAWQKKGNGETPESSGIKGDHLAGKYYVEFDKMLSEEAAQLKEQILNGNFNSIDLEAREAIQKTIGLIQNTSDEAKLKDLNAQLKQQVNNQTPLMKEARDMLIKWEHGDEATIELWKKMNSWVYAGFNQTYEKMGVHFDKLYYESQTYLLGKDLVERGLQSGVLYREPDGSVWIDLTKEGLDKKLLLRSDGTSVYMTQDIGTAVMRHDELNASKYIYVVGNEQDYHFKVLKEVLLKMNMSWADGIYHLSYGMVDLPSGRMKSREGTVVDADDLMAETISEAAARSMELGKTDEMSEKEKANLFDTLGMGALKYYILKVDPRKRMVFNPQESIDLQGNTGPFIQYTYARINSLLVKGGFNIANSASLQKPENDEACIPLIRSLEQFAEVVHGAAEAYSPAMVANYMYELAKEYNSFYHDNQVLKEADARKAAFRLLLSYQVAQTLKLSGELLGMRMPERM